MRILIFSDGSAENICDQIEADFCIRPHLIGPGTLDSSALKGFRAILDDKDSLFLLISKSGYNRIMEYVLAIRSCSDIPIILAAENISMADEYILRNAGVDDLNFGAYYNNLLCLKIKSAKRWIDRISNSVEKNSIHFGSWIFQKNVRSVISPNKKVFRISQNEHRFLELLLQRKGEVITRSEISRHVFMREWDPTDKSIDVLVSKLRCRFRKEDRSHALAIENIRGLGYTLKLG